MDLVVGDLSRELGWLREFTRLPCIVTVTFDTTRRCFTDAQDHAVMILEDSLDFPAAVESSALVLTDTVHTNGPSLSPTPGYWPERVENASQKPPVTKKKYYTLTPSMRWCWRSCTTSATHTKPNFVHTVPPLPGPPLARTPPVAHSSSGLSFTASYRVETKIA